MKILILGSNGLVGKSLTKILSNDKENFEIVSSNRDVCDLLNFQNTVLLRLSNKSYSTSNTMYVIPGPKYYLEDGM